MIRLPEPVTTGQLTTFDRRTRGKTVPVRPGETSVLGEVDGPGYLATIWLTFPGWFWAHWDPDRPVNQRIMKSMVLSITFDHAPRPQVLAPIADLCGVGLARAANFSASRLGMSSGGFYLRFPMPYREHVRIEVTNLDPEHGTDVFANVLHQSVAELPAETPYLHAFFATGRNEGADDLRVADVTGSGKYVGCTLSVQSERQNTLSFLEAPEHIRIDGGEEPVIVGTGMEDYFLGGWYFREGPVIGPTHGVPVKDALGGSVAMYRLHDEDAIHFDRRFTMAFVPTWPAERLTPYAFSTVAFCYLAEPTAAPELPEPEHLWPWYRVRDTDHQSIP